MCATCKEALTLHAAGDDAKALAVIGNAILGGKDPDHFNDVEDVIIGNEAVAEADTDLDEAWERGRR